MPNIKINFQEIVSNFVLGHLPLEDLPDIALKAIVGGYDSPSLRQLAGASNVTHEELRGLFTRATTELKVNLPSLEEAGIQVASTLANDVLEGKITPYEGAKDIWDKVYTLVPTLKRLKPFVGLASEYEDDISHREEYSRDIIQECEKFTKSLMT